MQKLLLSIAAAAALAFAPAAAADPMTTTLFEVPTPGVSVSVTFDNVTGEVSGLSWVVPSGTLKVSIDRPGQPSLQFARTSDGSIQVPANRYFLVQDRGGAWGWRQSSYSIGWNP